LLANQLDLFLAEMEHRYSQHFALAATLACTGLRFCHASALRWENFDAESAILHVRRRQLRGRVGRVSLVKRAPTPTICATVTCTMCTATMSTSIGSLTELQILRAARRRIDAASTP